MEEKENAKLHKEEGDILRITVHFCDKIKSDILLTHPIVCMHVVDATDGSYIKKCDRNRSVTFFYENQRGDVDYIMPIMTQPCTASGEKLHLLIWEESFILNECFDYFVKKDLNVVLFFEIIDLNPVFRTKQRYERLNRNRLQKIAWAFLKVAGSNDVINTGSKMRLQLFKPCSHYKNSKSSKIEVYNWWRYLPRMPLQASIYVSVEPYSSVTVEPALRSMLPMQEEVGTTKADHLTEGNTDIAVHAQDAFQSMSVMDNEKEIKWSRKKGELCKIPTKVSVSLETVNVCQILKFSNFGRILATGSGNLNQFYLSVYEIPSGKLLLRKLAHTQVIYDLDWSQKDNFILSASGDYSVKMWNTKSWSTVNSFIHPSFVYSAKFHPSEENILATACFDHVIRIWAFKQSTELLKELEAHNHSINTLCWNPDGKKLFSADDSGQVKVWKIPQKGNYLMSNGNDAYTLEKELSLPEIKGISINKIVPGVAKAILYLLCSDYIVRQVDLSNGSIIFHYESAIKHQAPLCGCCSPCGSLLFACNGDGRVVVWNLNTPMDDLQQCLDYSTVFLTVGVINARLYMQFGDRLAQLQNATSFVPVNAGCFSCIDYHPYEHMMAISSWEDSIPLYLYVNDEVSETNVSEKMIVHIEDSSCKETVNDYFSGAPHMEKKKLLRSANATKDCEIVPGVKMLNFRSGVKKNYGKQNPKLSFESSESDENFAKSSTDATESSSSDIFMDHPKKSDKSDSLTAVVTKSGQFDVINVLADFKKSDTSDNRSQDSNGQSSAVPKSSKRSLRRKKLKELYF